jgi:hypothetical protein
MGNTNYEVLYVVFSFPLIIINKGGVCVCVCTCICACMCEGERESTCRYMGVRMHVWRSLKHVYQVKFNIVTIAAMKITLFRKYCP